MKKILLCILLTLSFLFANTNSCKAYNSSLQKEYIGDGYYFETEIFQSNLNILGSSKITAGSKKVSYKHNDTVLWTVTVNGKFTYNGISATCTNSTVETTCPSSAWKITNKSSSKSANKAIASATGKNYLLGICIQTVSKTVTLTCSTNGKLS